MASSTICKSILQYVALGALTFSGVIANAQSHSPLMVTVDNPAPGVQDNFGRNLMATADGMILAGAQTNVGNVNNAGNGYLINASNGAIVHTMPNPEPESDVGFSAFSWAGDTRILISAFQKDDGSNTESGRAYIFNRATGAHTRTILNPTPGTMEQFGYGVGMLGDRAIIGARGDDTAGTDAGIVYVFDSISGELLRTIPNPDPSGPSNFGYSVAGIGADKVLVGAPGATVNGVASAGMVFLVNANTGALIHKIENPHPVESGFFGFQVRAFGEDLLVGSPNNNKAYLYDGETGALIYQFDNPVMKAGDVFGSTVSQAGGNILVGNPQPYPENPEPGVAYLYSGATGALLHTYNNPTPEPEDRFGVSVAGVNGKIVISGDQNKVNNMPSVGSIYVFNAPPAAACCEWNLYE